MFNLWEEKMTEKEIIKVLNEEIKWHKNYFKSDDDLPKDYKEGFLVGLQQAVRLIKAGKGDGNG